MNFHINEKLPSLIVLNPAMGNFLVFYQHTLVYTEAVFFVKQI